MPQIKSKEALKSFLLTSRLLSPADWNSAAGQISDATSVDAILQTLERRQLLTPFQSGRIQKGETEGLVLGRYKLLYRNASGSFARVFRAASTDDNSIVALKLLRERWVDDPRTVASFEREARICQKFIHPNIVSILDIGNEGRFHYFTMEFIEGGNLRDFMNIRKTLSPLEATRCIYQICQGLEYALKMGASHRDLKLTNVLMSSTGVAKLVDFGLAGAENAAQAGTSDDVQRALEYSTLERGTNAPRNDPRSDIFFAGSIYYELLCGEGPWSRTIDREEKLQLSRYSNVRPLKQVLPGLPEGIYRIVKTMMELNPSSRYQNYVEVNKDLRTLLAELGEPTGDAGKKSSASSGVPGAKSGSSSGGKSDKKSFNLMVVEPGRKREKKLKQYFEQYSFALNFVEEASVAFEKLKGKTPPDGLLFMADVDAAPVLELYSKVQAYARTLKVPCVAVFAAEEADAVKKQIYSTKFGATMFQPTSPRDLRQHFAEIAGFDCGPVAPAEPPKRKEAPTAKTGPASKSPKLPEPAADSDIVFDDSDIEVSSKPAAPLKPSGDKPKSASKASPPVAVPSKESTSEKPSEPKSPPLESTPVSAGASTEAAAAKAPVPQLNAAQKAAAIRAAQRAAEREAIEKAAAEKAAAERAIIEKAEQEAQEKAARERAELDRIAAEKAAVEEAARKKIEEEERVAREKVEAARKAAEEAERKKAEEERIAREKAEAKRLAAEEAVRKKAEDERIAKEKAEAERLAAEEAARKKVEDERLAREKAEAERVAAEEAARKKAEDERLAAEEEARKKIEEERIAAEKTVAERLAAEEAARKKAEEERIAAEKAEAERLAAEEAARKKAEEERIAAEKAEAERRAAEEAARKAEEDRIAKLRAEEDRRIAEEAARIKAEEERIAAERVAAAERARAEIELAEKAMAEKFAAARRALEEQQAAALAAAEKAQLERLAAEKLAAEKLAAERAIADRERAERDAAEKLTAVERAQQEVDAAARELTARIAAAERVANGLEPEITVTTEASEEDQLLAEIEAEEKAKSAARAQAEEDQILAELEAEEKARAKLNAAEKSTATPAPATLVEVSTPADVVDQIEKKSEAAEPSIIDIEASIEEKPDSAPQPQAAKQNQNPSSKADKKGGKKKGSKGEKAPEPPAKVQSPPPAPQKPAAPQPQPVKAEASKSEANGQPATKPQTVKADTPAAKAEPKSKETVAEKTSSKEKSLAPETPEAPAAKSSAGKLIVVGGVIVAVVGVVVWFALFQ
ncbi:MAG: protein kinase [Planctomycetales bacterium]|nr:protein kinase [Planctomycetales bacterium]